MKLISEIRSCTLCADFLPLGPRPVVHFSSQSKIVIVGQAPGIRVHNTGVPWNDPSGDRLREWLQVSKDEFYNEHRFGIVPMGFCYPGTAERGDLPPRPECSQQWMGRILSSMPHRKLTLLIGQYAQKFFLGTRRKKSLTETVRSWHEYAPDFFVLPHPSPRNNIWLKKNPWFETEALPALRKIVQTTAD